MARLRTLLVLGRVSNLPTVWSNCLAGWWLGGGENFNRLPFLFAGASFLYVGGMYLNDAFDMDFDRQHRKERPIPKGAVSADAVWLWGLGWLALGIACLFWLGLTTGLLAVALTICIIFYDAIHKMITFSPVLMGVCRLFVYLIAASSAADGVTGWAVWCGLALGAYIAGLSFLAQRESLRGPLQYWPLLLMSAPIVLALIMNANGYRSAAITLSVILLMWTAWSLLPLLRGTGHWVKRAVSGLLAGIVFVDLLAIADVCLGAEASHRIGPILLLLFVTTLILQRFVPAT